MCLLVVAEGGRIVSLCGDVDWICSDVRGTRLGTRAKVKGTPQPNPLQAS